MSTAAPDADSSQPPSISTVAVPLDALLSPPGDSELDTERQFVRASIAESDFSDVGLEDESRLSVVALESAADESSPPQSASPSPKLSGRPQSSSSATTLHDTVSKTSSTASSHKKSASTTTIRSVNKAPFLLARLDIQKAEEDSRSNRGSLDGQQKLQEEFTRLQEHADQVDNSAIDWDFWGLVMSDYQALAADQPEQLAQAIEKGIPDTLRGMVWQLMSASKDTELEDTYQKLLKEESPHEKSIMRDLGRTFPHHEFFTDSQGIGQENLFNVLKAYSLYDPQVGFCQGLPFVVAILLLNMPDEEAFCLLVRLMHSYQLRGHFLPEMPGLQLRLFQFDRLVEELLPVLHVHFLRQGIKSSMYCSQWFLTLFSYRFPQDIVYRIFDSCLANGIEAIFGFSVALLVKNEETLLTLKFDELLGFLNTKLFDVYKVDPADDSNGRDTKYRVDEYIQDASSLRITPFTLDSFSNEYEEVLRRNNAHAIEIDKLRNTNRILSSQVKTLESSLAQLNTEHVELLNQLVMSRLRNEEMEEQLVRYKLLAVLPKEWTSTMRPLQDQCEPTHLEAVEALFLSDMGQPISELFDDFDPNPIGVASLAQVHVGHHRESGKRVAIKLQHPHLAEFCDIDMEMVQVTMGWIKYWFPEFEFTWLAEEMRVNLPKEMDFVHEANNAARANEDFRAIRTSMYIPEVITATKRVLIMEFIQGGRVDDLAYLADQGIDRNKVALELSRIFNQMVFINGWFHADPHPGNLLIRPAPPKSKSPYNFEIVLLDHGLYFDLSPELRINYSKFWLSLIAPASPQTTEDRRKYAELVGNIGPDLYPIFEAAITGRAAMEGSWDDDGNSNPSGAGKAESSSSAFKRASGMIDMMPQTDEEMQAIRNAVISQEGLLVSVFDVLRRIPRRVLMVLKLNDLTRFGFS
ncbi:hypothetical protein HGRIS_002129 [Hohenbuehelia grisea]|uniref:Rab-GAP TBC domain-containing protein n=1 Tax=Hohenbuehelia grisea TaxID=104357 RepID=A0ABR3JLE5_9AGAR